MPLSTNDTHCRGKGEKVVNLDFCLFARSWPSPPLPAPGPTLPSPGPTLSITHSTKKTGYEFFILCTSLPFSHCLRLPFIVFLSLRLQWEPKHSFVVALQHPENSVTPLHDVSDGIGVHCDIETPSKCTGIFHIIGERIMLSFKSTALRFTFSCFKKEHNHTLCCSFYYLQF